MKCKFKKKKGLKSPKRQGAAAGAPIQYSSFNLVAAG